MQEAPLIAQICGGIILVALAVMLSAFSSESFKRHFKDR